VWLGVYYLNISSCSFCCFLISSIYFLILDTLADIASASSLIFFLGVRGLRFFFFSFGGEYFFSHFGFGSDYLVF
jgi:hypothetical protein